MNTTNGYRFNPPPTWPVPNGFLPADGWKPDPSWPAAPADWQFWILEPQAPRRPQAPASTPTIEQPKARTSQAAPDRTQASVEPDDRDQIILDLRVKLAQALEQAATALDTPTPPPADIVDLDDERVLQEVGIYRYHHPLENAAQFKDRLTEINDEIKALVKDGDAVLASDMFTFNNSLAKGRKMTKDLSKLMLRAYNAEADTCVRSLRGGNSVTAKKRLERTVTTIAKLGSMMEMRISPDYHELRIREIDLTSDFAMKKQEEREAEREERARLREERKVEQELAAEREQLAKERSHLENALKSLQASGDEDGASEIAEKLGELDSAIEENDYRTANVRAGYVYVISNRGAFGGHMIKIGMTRRLEPMDRVRELGDASVPFPFDVHALFFSEDAVTLENELHKAFSAERVNHVNLRREFFFATPDQVRHVLVEKVGNLLEFNEHPEAEQYSQSKGYWPTAVS